MAQTHRAPKQWQLTKVETITSFDSWRQNLVYTLSCDDKFAIFLADGAQWEKRTKANAKTRGFANDGNGVPEQKRRTAIQKCIDLELMLGQIANFCPVIARNSIIRDSTSLPQIWQAIRLHYGFQSTGAHFLDISNIQLETDERPEDLYQRLLAFVDDNLLTPESNINHHGAPITDAEDITPTLENMIVWLWLNLLHKDLPRVVKQRYGTELRSRTLASIKPEISQSLDGLLEDISANSGRALRTSTWQRKKGPSFAPMKPSKHSKSCPICKQSGRSSYAHFLSECKYLPESDRKYLMKARQVAGLFTSDIEREEGEVSEEEEDTQPTHASRVQVRQSPYLDMFHEHSAVRVIMDTGATGNMIRASAVERLGVRVMKSSQSAHQADGSSPLSIVGEARLDLEYDGITHHFEGLVVQNLDVDILAGMPFMEANDISIRPAKRLIVLRDGRKCGYGSTPRKTHSILRAHVIRAPSQTVTVWPGGFLEVPVPEEREGSVAIEPSSGLQGVKSLNSWPVPAVLTCVAGKVRIPNDSPSPIIVKRHCHIAKAFPVYEPTENNISIARGVMERDGAFSSEVKVDPDTTLPDSVRDDFMKLLEKYDSVFNPEFPGYNGNAGPFQGVVNMGPTQPPQRKGRLPQYARDRLEELQQKFDELESLGVFRKPEDLGITAEYLNPSFLVSKSSGGTRLVTAFTEVGKYSKPQPSLLPDVNSTLQQIGQWKYIICSDLSKAFYQIPLSKESMRYCGVATPFRGVRVYARCAMGMPGSETALEELMCRVLGDLLQEGIVTKLADDLYCGANSPHELLQNWKRVLQALDVCALKLSASKTVISPKSANILGWLWHQGTISASPHKVSSLSSCSRPATVKAMRSFIGAYKVLARVLPNCSSYIVPLDKAIAGKDSKDTIVWNDQLCEAFDKAQSALSTCKSIVLPRRSDQLWIVTDGSVKKRGIAATLYVIRDGSRKVAGFFSAKLRDRQVLWLPCEVEALAIASGIHHFSPFIIQSEHKASVLTDSKPCVQAYQKLCRGEFSASPRVTTFLSAVSRYQVSVTHIKGVNNLLADYASRNPSECNDTMCQVCSFIMQTEDSVVRQSSVQDILSGKTRAPFTNRSAWSSIQSECSDLRRTAAHLRQGTRPSKKQTQVKDIKRYLQVASVARDGLLVVSRKVPLSVERECVIVPRFAIDGLLTALHLQLDHPTEHQLKTVFMRYLYALDLGRAVENVTRSCHTCTALQKSQKALVEQSTGAPQHVGRMFAADILKRESQKILVVREYVTSFTVTKFIEDEGRSSIRDGLVMCCVGLVPLDGPSCIIRTDCATGFQALCDDDLLKKHNIVIELGRVKNVNKNPVADKAVRELEEEVVRAKPNAGRLSSLELCVITARLNSRIRGRGLSSREMWHQRDQFTSDQLPVCDQDLISEQFMKRNVNHDHSEKSKASGAGPRKCADVKVGDIVYLYADGTKHLSRERYLVVSVDGEWCNVQKFRGRQLRNVTYRIKKHECFKVKPTVPELEEKCSLPSEEDETVQVDFKCNEYEIEADKHHAFSESGLGVIDPLVAVPVDTPNSTPESEVASGIEDLARENSATEENVQVEGQKETSDKRCSSILDTVSFSSSEQIEPSENRVLRRSGRRRQTPRRFDDYVAHRGRIIP